MYFQNALCRVLHERSNILALFPEHPRFKERVAFTNAIWVNSGKSK